MGKKSRKVTNPWLVYWWWWLIDWLIDWLIGSVGAVSKRWSVIRCKLGPGPLHSHVAVKMDTYMLIIGGEKHGVLSDEVWRFHFGQFYYYLLLPLLLPLLALLPPHLALDGNSFRLPVCQFQFNQFQLNAINRSICPINSIDSKLKWVRFPGNWLSAMTAQIQTLFAVISLDLNRAAGIDWIPSILNRCLNTNWFEYWQPPPNS